jgi:SAM-dependent methyltransferase
MDPHSPSSADLSARWDARYAEGAGAPPPPARVLSENRHLLPAQGDALDLACGLGANAALLAESGLRVKAWDISAVAIEAVRRLAAARGLTITAGVRDVLASPPPVGGFDVIVVSRFLERALAPALVDALRPGGLLFYQTFTRVTPHPETGPRTPEYRLGPQELLRLFADLEPLVYRDEGLVGDPAHGLRGEALLVGRCPLPGEQREVETAWD